MRVNKRANIIITSIIVTLALHLDRRMLYDIPTSFADRTMLAADGESDTAHACSMPNQELRAKHNHLQFQILEEVL